MQMTAAWLLVLAGLAFSTDASAADSRCFGSVNRGRIEDSVKLLSSGANFSAYSTLAASVGRTHVHSKVAAIVGSAYAALEKELPSTAFVFGETGLASGGRFRPHRSHQNGTSVDFFVPVRNAQGRSVPLPTSVLTRFGYDIEFDAKARWREYEIDFEAIAEHLYQLDRAARSQGAGIALVIFDPRYLPRLFATQRGPSLRQLPFMKGTPWVRHDEHYHVDFAVSCEPDSTSTTIRVMRASHG